MNDLIERYIYAATKHLPKKQREDVAQELRGLIDDMLTERCGSRIPGEKDIRIVLMELGGPRELYEKYAGEGEKCLIGQPYYSIYLFVMKIVLPCVFGGLSLSSLILYLMEPTGVWAALGTWLGILWNGMLSAFAIVTILFAFFYHKSIPLEKPFDFDNLPPVPKKREEIPRGDCIFGIVFTLIFAVVFLMVPQIFCAPLPEAKRLIPIFDPEVVHSTWYLVVLFSICGIVDESVKLREGRYNRRVLVVTVVTDLLSAVLSVIWLGGFPLMNPEFVSEIHNLFGSNSKFIENIFANFQYFWMGCILFALALEVGVTVYKTLNREK